MGVFWLWWFLPDRGGPLLDVVVCTPLCVHMLMFTPCINSDAPPPGGECVAMACTLQPKGWLSGSHQHHHCMSVPECVCAFPVHALHVCTLLACTPHVCVHGISATTDVGCPAHVCCPACGIARVCLSTHCTHSLHVWSSLRHHQLPCSCQLWQLLAA